MSTKSIDFDLTSSYACIKAAQAIRISTMSGHYLTRNQYQVGNVSWGQLYFSSPLHISARFGGSLMYKTTLDLSGTLSELLLYYI